MERGLQVFARRRRIQVDNTEQLGNSRITEPPTAADQLSHIYRRCRRGCAKNIPHIVIVSFDKQTREGNCIVAAKSEIFEQIWGPGILDAKGYYAQFAFSTCVRVNNLSVVRHLRNKLCMEVPSAGSSLARDTVHESA